MFLYRNMSPCEAINRLQKKLEDLNLYNGGVDGVFGEMTEDAVIQFQMKNGLNADGVVGPKTAMKLGISIADVVFPVDVPNGRAEIVQTFGDPLLSGYAEAYLDFCSTPPELNHVFTYKHKTTDNHGFYCNKLLVIPFGNVYKNIVMAGLEQELHTFDGCFNIRNIRGKNSLSTHSWGIAVDHDAALNPLGAESKMHPGIVKCFEGLGFTWGGNWKRKDAMHFQYAQGY